MSTDAPKETREEKAQRLLNKQMDSLRERAMLVEKAARNHAGSLPNGDAEMYARYIATITARMTAAFESSAPIPYFGGAWEDDD